MEPEGSLLCLQEPVPVLSTIRELNCENFAVIQVLLNKRNLKLKVWIFILCLIELWSKLLLVNIISLKHKCFRYNMLYSWCIFCISIFSTRKLLLKSQNSRGTCKNSLTTHTHSYTYWHTYTHSHTHRHSHTLTHTHTHTHINTHTHTHTHRHTHTHTHKHSRTHSHTHKNTHTHTHTLTLTH